uniref:Transposase n=1 Tax=Steinernema glaseri TaxID=37863 RepID=A0A1I7YJ04_9BILA
MWSRMKPQMWFGDDLLVADDSRTNLQHRLALYKCAGQSRDRAKRAVDFCQFVEPQWKLLREGALTASESRAVNQSNWNGVHNGD